MSIKYNNLFEKIVSFDNALNAARKAKQGQSKFSLSSIKFMDDEIYNINKLMESLNNNEHQPSEYNHFHVKEPKEREIYAPCFVDKVVHHMVNNVLKDIYNKCFINDSYSYRENKGIHECSRVINYYKRTSNDNNYVIFVDIRSFFYSIDHTILKTLFRKKIKCKKTLNLLDKIVDFSPTKRGLPLGNLTSQLFANIYLNELDNYIKRELQVKKYVRYADDCILIVNNKKSVQNIFKKIESFLNNKLNLQLNKNKSNIFPIKNSINSVGFKHYGHFKLLRNDCKKKIKRNLRKYLFGAISKKKFEQMLNSWLGHAIHANSYNFIINLLNRYDFLDLKNQKLIIKEI